MKTLKNIFSFSLMVLFGGLMLVNHSCDNGTSYRDGILFSGTQIDPVVSFTVEQTPAGFPLSVMATDKVTKNTTVRLDIRPELVDEYNQKMGTNYWQIPAGTYSLEDDKVVIEAGSSVSSTVNVYLNNEEGFETGRVYLIPVTITGTDSDFDVIEAGRTIYLKISRKLYFAAPSINNANMAYQFLLPNPVPVLPQYTFEFKIYLQAYKSGQQPGRVCSFGGTPNSIEGSGIPDGGEKCDEVLVRFNESQAGGDVLRITTKSGNIEANTRFELRRWYMVSLVNDGNQMILYVDGERDNVVSVSPYDYALYGVEIGMPADNYASSQLQNARLCEMRLWGRPLTAREIRGGVCGTDPYIDGCISYWRMNEGEGKTFYDSSPSERHIAYTTNITINWTEGEENSCIE